VHLVRNAFDHGIETPDVRRQHGKAEQGKIEIRAYHQGSQTIIEVRDDGRGVNLERIRTKALEMGLLTPEQAATTDPSQLLELLFEPGFSTASQVSQLSGRGVGLDVVRAQLRSLKGSVTLTSEPGQGTVFTLRIPLTLTIAKLLVCFIGTNAFAFPSDSIAEILIPQPEQVKQSGGKRFLHWQGQIVPTYHLSQLLRYACPLPETQPSQALAAVPTPDDWASPMLLLEQDDQMLALEVDRLVTEQELVIKPFGGAIAPPSYVYGCTILGDGCLMPVIDAAGLLNAFFSESKITTFNSLPSLPVDEVQADAAFSSPTAPSLPKNVHTVLVVDDSITVRQTLALTLQKADYRVLQARDGREAINQLQQNTNIHLVICDVEMPNMNGFEFLSHRRQDPQLSQAPVVMLTSRSSDKHRQLAMHLGAKNYFTKPYIEQEFLTAIKNIIAQDAPTGRQAFSLSR
jgi:chemotaxis family two-component system sensor histidine kinase/response regulator PixL